jgi:hypothetical protein
MVGEAREEAEEFQEVPQKRFVRLWKLIYTCLSQNYRFHVPRYVCDISSALIYVGINFHDRRMEYSNQVTDR